MEKKVYPFLLVLILMALGIVLVQKSKQKQTTTQPEVRTEKISVKGKIIEGFPNLPVPPDSRVEESYRKESGGKVGYEAEYITEMSAQEAMIWYREELKRLGWTTTKEEIEGVESEFSLMVEKAGEKVNIFAEREDGETEITIEVPLH